MKMEVLSENSDPSTRSSNASQAGVRISQQAATPQQSTVLFTTPQQGTQITLQQPISNLSIVHVQPLAQSVIQPASHTQGSQATTSVIQATSAGAIQNLKNPVLLTVNKGSVIQSAAGQQVAEEVPVQLVHGGVIGGTLAEDEGTRKRREVLARRPSYRKILNDLSMPQHDGQTMGTLQTDVNTPQYVQYSNDGQLFVPVTVSGVGDLQTYQLRPAQVTGASTPVVVTTGGVSQTSQPMGIAEEAARKRELRLLKNREAAKECRRKKKDYIKCLENRVAVLENQNAVLIEELKTLKDLCSKKNVNDM